MWKSHSRYFFDYMSTCLLPNGRRQSPPSIGLAVLVKCLESCVQFTPELPKLRFLRLAFCCCRWNNRYGSSNNHTYTFARSQKKSLRLNLAYLVLTQRSPFSIGFVLKWTGFMRGCGLGTRVVRKVRYISPSFRCSPRRAFNLCTLAKPVVAIALPA